MNGENNTNYNNQPVLTPMNGVTYAPPTIQPITPGINTTPPVQTVETTPVTVPVITPPIPPTTPTPSKKEPKKKNLTPLWLIIIAFLIMGIVGTSSYMNKKITETKYNCTPITSSKEEKELDLETTLVQSLYNKVKTSIKEDVAHPTFDDDMKLYLAYRQISDYEKYDSNCHQFSLTSMEPYTCQVSQNFVPKAFKEETLLLKIKEMYGENITLSLKNIQLGNTCVVGYQYIPTRGEFVEGYCNKQSNITLAVTKELVKAVSTRNTIILTEQVKYRSKSGAEVPKSLKSGRYHYIFRLDMNYNYVLINKTYESEY